MNKRILYVLLSLLIPVISYIATDIVYKQSINKIESKIGKLKSLEYFLPTGAQEFINNKFGLLAQKVKENVDTSNLADNIFCKLLFLIGLITFIICIILAHITSNLLLRYSLIDGGFFAFIIGIFMHPCLFQKNLGSIILWLILIGYIAFYEYYSRKKRNVRQIDSTYLP